MSSHSDDFQELEVVGEETTDAVVRPEESTVPHDEFSLDLTKKKKKKKKVEYIDEPGHGGGADTDVVEDGTDDASSAFFVLCCPIPLHHLYPSTAAHSPYSWISAHVSGVRSYCTEVY